MGPEGPPRGSMPGWADSSSRLGPWIGVHAASRLPAEPTRPNVLPDKRRRTELRIARLAEQDFHHVQADINARVVREFEGAHRHLRPDFHRLVDVLGAPAAFLHEAARPVHHPPPETVPDAT